MKKLALATAITVAASTAFAGGLDDPIVEADIIVEETSSSAGGIVVPIMFLIFLAAIASN